MRWLVSYDISDDARRQRLATVLLDYGQRVQESVFWIEMEDGLETRIRERLLQVVSRESDSLWIVPICAACSLKVETVGGGGETGVPGVLYLLISGLFSFSSGD